MKKLYPLIFALLCSLLLCLPVCADVSPLAIIGPIAIFGLLIVLAVSVVVVAAVLLGRAIRNRKNKK